MTTNTKKKSTPKRRKHVHRKPKKKSVEHLKGFWPLDQMNNVMLEEQTVNLKEHVKVFPNIHGSSAMDLIDLAIEKLKGEIEAEEKEVNRLKLLTESLTVKREQLMGLVALTNKVLSSEGK